jgi:hypothetical protein
MQNYIALLAILLAACSSPPGYRCATDTQCNGAAGERCATTGWCAAPASDCASGYAYTRTAGDNQAGLCVEQFLEHHPDGAVDGGAGDAGNVPDGAVDDGGQDAADAGVDPTDVVDAAILTDTPDPVDAGSDAGPPDTGPPDPCAGDPCASDGRRGDFCVPRDGQPLCCTSLSAACGGSSVCPTLPYEICLDGVGPTAAGCCSPPCGLMSPPPSGCVVP